MSGRNTQPNPSNKNREHPLDARLAHINDTILPTAPYLLGVEGSALSKEYIQRVYHHTMNDWRKGTNFDLHEEELQYMTFKDRSRDGSITGLRTRGGWDDGNGAIVPIDEPSSRSSGDMISLTGMRKKITLAEYKKKRDQNPDKPSITETEKVEAIKKDLNRGGIVKNETRPVSAEKAAQGNGQKRTVNAMTSIKGISSVSGHAESALPAKRARVSAEGSAIVPKQDMPVAVADPSRPGSEGLQQPASEVSQKPVSENLTAKGNLTEIKAKKQQVPTQKPVVENGTASENTKSATESLDTSPPCIKPEKLILPPMLSPLASDIEDELAKLGPLVRKRSHSAASVQGSSESPVVKKSKMHHAETPSSSEKVNTKRAQTQNLSTPTRGPQDNRQITSAPRQGTGALASKLPQTSKVAQTTKLAAEDLTNGSTEDLAHTTKSTHPDGGKLRLRVTLFVKKKQNRKTLLQYLRMKPTSGKGLRAPHHEARPEMTKSEAKLRTTTNTPRLESSKAGDKRRRSDEGEPQLSVKRPKAPGSIAQNVKTPKAAPTNSTALKQMAQLAAPELEPRSTPMVRGISREGSVHTPQESAHKKTISDSYTQEMRLEAKKYMALAKELKYDADKFFKNPEGMTVEQRKQGVITGIESVLCFMLAFRIYDAERKVVDHTGWNSILGLLGKIESEAKESDHYLYGLARQLEGVIRDILVHVDVKSLDVDPLDDQFANAASADPNKTEDQNRAFEYHRRFSEFFQHTTQSHLAWGYGLRELSSTDIATKFPKTWAKRDEFNVPLDKGISQKVAPRQYKRPYSLPLGRMSTALEAVNFGLDFLEEYCRTKEVKWRPKLVL